MLADPAFLFKIGTEVCFAVHFSVSVARILGLQNYDWWACWGSKKCGTVGRSEKMSN